MTYLLFVLNNHMTEVTGGGQGTNRTLGRTLNVLQVLLDDPRERGHAHPIRLPSLCPFHLVEDLHRVFRLEARLRGGAEAGGYGCLETTIDIETRIDHTPHKWPDTHQSQIDIQTD